MISAPIGVLLEAAINLSHLKTLNFRCTNSNCELLAEVLSGLGQLESIGFLTDLREGIVESLKNMKGLREIKVSTCQVDADTVRADEIVSMLMQLPAMDSLEFSTISAHVDSCGIRDTDLKCILQRNTNLKNLRLSEFGVIQVSPTLHPMG